jgi:hypothetical protein
MKEQSTAGLAALVAGLEQEALRRQCEAALVFPPPGALEILVNLGYQQSLLEELNSRPWREAAAAWQPVQSAVFLKVLSHSDLLPVSYSSMKS